MVREPSEQEIIERLRRQILRQRRSESAVRAPIWRGVRRRRGASRPPRSPLRRALVVAGIVVLAAVAPFFLLLRTTTLLYVRTGTGTWGSLVLAATATFLLLTAYAAIAARRLRGRFHISRFLLRGLALLVGAYCLYGLLYMSSAHAK
ncbi:MAG TPA: hypothetical protein VJ957_05690, partial [Longimicrobiales bacterium]|nr:hypothetical protein [Longimicrobiales bacterium]